MLDEERADPIASAILDSMHSAGEAFLQLETDPADAPDVAAMQTIMGDIETLQAAEQAEPADQDEPGPVAA
jgi:hypothetical protein